LNRTANQDNLQQPLTALKLIFSRPLRTSQEHASTVAEKNPKRCPQGLKPGLNQRFIVGAKAPTPKKRFFPQVVKPVRFHLQPWLAS
jgi:hypothetical protein